MSEKIFDALTRLLASRRTGFLYEDELLGLYAETLADSVFITDQPTRPDCLTCGACCAYFHQILISIADSTPRALAWEVADADGQVTHWLKRETQEARCLALAGKIGERVDCSIYELRPTACRAFEAGSDRCHALRRMFGFEPPLSSIGRAHHIQTLKENPCEETIDIEMPDTLGDESAQIDFLRALVAYNLEKLEAIFAEVMRLKNLLEASGARPAAERCQQTLETIYGEAQLLKVEMSGPDFTGEIELLSEPIQHELMSQFLVFGNHSQEILKGAASRLAALGELAFEVLGMNAKVKR